MIQQLFLQHPRSIGKGYWQHLFGAWRYAFKLQKASWSAILHGAVPAVCQTTASDIVQNLYLKGQTKDANARR